MGNAVTEREVLSCRIRPRNVAIDSR